MNEAKLITLLNTNENYNFVAMDDKFSRYDAFDTENGIMLEIKCRKKHYDDTLLEKMKYDWNKAYALENDLSFMYAVSMPDKGGHKIYLFDPIIMEEEDEEWGAEEEANYLSDDGDDDISLSDSDEVVERRGRRSTRAPG